MGEFRRGQRFSCKYPFHMDYDNYGEWYFRGIRREGDINLADGEGKLHMKVLSTIKTSDGMQDRIVTENFMVDPAGNKSNRWVKMSTVSNFKYFLKNGPLINYTVVSDD